MKIVVQRVKRASVSVDNQIVSSIDQGLLLLVGLEENDTQGDMVYLARKVVNLRIFEDDQEKMNLSVKDVEGSLLAVSQFTLAANTERGNRPSFSEALEANAARAYFEKFVTMLEQENIRVETGVFQAMTEVSLVNDGPVTILLESKGR